MPVLYRPIIAIIAAILAACCLSISIALNTVDGQECTRNAYVLFTQFSNSVSRYTKHLAGCTAVSAELPFPFPPGGGGGGHSTDLYSLVD